MSKRAFAAALFAAASTAVLAVPPAQASPPYIVHYKDLPAVYIDNVMCSFDVAVNGSDHVTVRYYATKTVFVDKFRGTVTGPFGTQLLKTEDAVITDDFATGNETWNGLAESFSYPDGGTIARDTGKITFDSGGNIVAEHGPHPIADGPGNIAVCNALSS
jgi:hypothetical protein